MVLNRVEDLVLAPTKMQRSKPAFLVVLLAVAMTSINNKNNIWDSAIRLCNKS